MSNRFLLEAKNIIKTFPPTVALNDVHFCLRPGEIHGLMGENQSLHAMSSFMRFSICAPYCTLSSLMLQEL